MLVSDRLRLLLERCVPNHAEFLPVVVTYNGEPLKVQRYWVVNWLFMVDCLDWSKSMWYQPKGTATKAERVVVNAVIDFSKIDSNVKICRIFGAESRVLISSDIRNLIEEAGITGCQFYTVDQHR